MRRLRRWRAEGTCGECRKLVVLSGFYADPRLVPSRTYCDGCFSRVRLKPVEVEPRGLKVSRT